jgi:LacI family transcriptional regulator
MQPIKLHRPRVLLMSNLSARFEREVALGIANYARQHTNWRVYSERDPDLEQVRQAPPAGIISFAADSRIEEFALSNRIVFVKIADPVPRPEICSVAVDERAIGTMAAEYFLSLGLKHFACVGHGNWPFLAVRLDNFVQVIEGRGLGPVHRFVGQMYDPRQRSRFERGVEALLLKLPRPCGLLAANDALGVELIEICQNIDVRVPDDVAIVGVDDDELTCELGKIPLSSIVQPFLRIGYEAGRVLDEHIKDPGCPPEQLLLAPLEVHPRASSDLIALGDVDVVAALRLINFHLAEPINVAWIVSQLPVARRSLERKFRKLVGRTILEQIHRARLQRAKDLLAESDLSLEMVAQRSGFVNARWLSDCFRKELKTTPTRFRREFRLGA